MTIRQERRLTGKRLCHHALRSENHKIYDVVLGRSELSLETYFQGLPGKEQVKVVCMDLATLAGKKTRPQGQDRSRSLPCHPVGESALPELLA